MKTIGDWSSAKTLSAHGAIPDQGVVTPMSTVTLMHLFCAPSPVAHEHSLFGAVQAEGGFRAAVAPANADRETSGRTNERTNAELIFIIIQFKVSE